MNQETINEIRKALEQATPGPWREEALNIWSDEDVLLLCNLGQGVRYWYDGGMRIYRQKDSEQRTFADSHLIPLLRNHAPALLDEIERLREENIQIKINAENDTNHWKRQSDNTSHWARRVAELEDDNRRLKKQEDEQNAVLRAATEKLKELNIENAELRCKIAEYSKADANLNQALNEGDGSYRP